MPKHLPRVNLAGVRSGGLVAQEFVGPDSGGRAQWRCLCDCGAEVVTAGYYVSSGRNTSCGDQTKHPRKPMTDLTGKTFGSLTALEPIKSGVQYWWRCRCECGNEHAVRANKLASGLATNCGCKTRAMRSASRKRTHCEACGHPRREGSVCCHLCARKAKRKHKAANPEAVRADSARRRAAEASNRVGWANRELIRDIYKLALIFRQAGYQCHVDHIVPLRSSVVSGLHVEANLSVLPSSDNIRKGNRWWPGMTIQMPVFA